MHLRLSGNRSGETGQILPACFSNTRNFFPTGPAAAAGSWIRKPHLCVSRCWKNDGTVPPRKLINFGIREPCLSRTHSSLPAWKLVWAILRSSNGLSLPMFRNNLTRLAVLPDESYVAVMNASLGGTTEVYTWARGRLVRR